MGLQRRHPHLSALARILATYDADHLTLRLDGGACSAIVVHNHFGDAIAVIDREHFHPDVHKDLRSLQLPIGTGDYRWPPHI